MKRILLLAFAIVASSVVMQAQSKELNDIFDKYEKKKSVESITISPSLLRMANNGGSEETRNLMEKINLMRILNIQEGIRENGQLLKVMLKGDLEGVIKKYQFQRVVKVEEDESSVEMYMINGNKGVVLFLSDDNRSFSVICTFGDIDKTVISSLLNGGIKVKR